MTTERDTRKAVTRLRARLATLVRRSAEKLEEMKLVQGRIEQLAAEVSEWQAKPGKKRKPGSK